MVVVQKKLTYAHSTDKQGLTFAIELHVKQIADQFFICQAKTKIPMIL